MEHSTQNQVALSDQPILVAELVEDAFFPSFNIDLIRISKTNRKRFNEVALNELGENIKANGLIQPILIRPVDPTADEPEIYEIVCGERRYRASKIAGLTTINVLIRKLSDTQAQELQLIENLQRENPHPMEEAEGYQQLMLKSGYTADMLAEKLDKSRSQIYATLKLCNLCKELRDEFFNNEKFTRSLALLVARIPVPALQVEAFEEIIDEYGNGEPMSYRDAADHIQTHYNVHLKNAIFSTTDAKLVADAGSCKTCPKRTGNDPDLADLDKNICTDAKCYESKMIAHNARIIEKAEANNITILRGETAKKAISQAINSAGTYAIDSTCLHCFARLKTYSDRNKMIRATIGSDKLPNPIAIAVCNDTPTNLYNSLHIQITLEELGFCETEAQARINARDQAKATEDIHNEDEDDEDEDDDLDHDYVTDQKKKIVVTPEKIAEEEARRTAIYKKIREKQTLSIESLRVFIQGLNRMLNLEIPKQLHEEFYGRRLNTDAEIDDYISTASVEQLQKLSLDFVFGDNISEPPHISMCDRYLNREDSIELLVKKLTEAEGITLDDKDELEEPQAEPPAEEPKPEAQVQEQPVKRGRGRPPKAKPEETKPWPFPEPVSN